jgi:hypothetical protein
VKQKTIGIVYSDRRRFETNLQNMVPYDKKQRREKKNIKKKRKKKK